MKCLLVDDEPGIREGLGALLRLKGHEVRTAADVAEALALLEAAAFDVVVTDWRLPDGTAEPLLDASPCPVVAMSGHPEEVAAAALRAQSCAEPFAVLGKPVTPRDLLAVLDEASAAVAALLPEPSQDAQEVLDRALDLLGRPAAARVDCDATFAVLRAPLPAGEGAEADAVLEALAELGGDLRVLAPDGDPVVELRVCRDGRPDPSLPVTAPTARWPEPEGARAFAVDFTGSRLSVDEFVRCLDLAAERTDAGATVHFCNVPSDLLRAVEGSGRGRRVPKRAKVGPRLPAVLVDLWSGA